MWKNAAVFMGKDNDILTGKNDSVSRSKDNDTLMGKEDKFLLGKNEIVMSIKPTLTAMLVIFICFGITRGRKMQFHG